MRFKIIAFFIGMLMGWVLHSSYGWAIGPYTVYGDMVIDEGTGLVWQNDADVTSKELTWEETFAYCENLTLGGYDDWRLPNIRELRSIVDYTRHSPAIDTTIFSCESSHYWSSTSGAGGSDYAWSVYFNYGYSNRHGKFNSYYIRCVRGGLSNHSGDSDSLIVKAPITITPSPSSISGDAPYLAAFSIQVSGGTPPYNFNWSFGDGSSGSSEQNPAHQYSAPGAYTATVTVTDSQGDTSTATIKVTVKEANKPPTASITASATEGTVPLKVAFAGSGTDPEGGELSFHWSFGDGDEGDGRTVNHTFSSPGDYTVRLTVTDSAGKQGTSDVVIHAKGAQAPPLSISFEASPREGYAPLDVAFSAIASGGSPNYAFSWQFGDGGTGTGDVATHTYSAPGEYTVTLTVTDSQGRQKTASMSIAVNGAQPDEAASGGASGKDTTYKDAGGGQAQGGASSGIGKAIIIAGSGAHRHNTLFPLTKEICNGIYKLLSKRGFSNSDIFYLNPVTWEDIDGDGRDDHVVDYGTVDEGTLEKAFEEVKKAIAPGEQFVFYFNGHGGKGGRLKLNGTDWMAANRLSALIDGLPEENVKIIIIDACYSGAFLNILKGKNRVILTSSDDVSASWNIQGQSFTQFLLEKLRRGLDIFTAFKSAEERMKSDERLFRGNSPWLDDNGDGVFSASIDGAFAKTLALGTIGIAASEPPVITTVHPVLEVAKADACSKAIWVKAVSGEEGGVQNVTAVVIPPGFSNQYDEDAPGSEIISDRTSLGYNPVQDRWEAVYDGFKEAGVWEIYYTAVGKGGERSDVVKSEVKVLEGCGEAAVNVLFNQQDYAVGDTLRFDVEVNAKGVYDLYVAIVFPGGFFVTFDQNHSPSMPNWIVPFMEDASFDGVMSVSVLELALPEMVERGAYQGCGVLSVPDTDPHSPDNWVDFHCRQFEIK